MLFLFSTLVLSFCFLLDLFFLSVVRVSGALLSFPARVNSVWRVAFNWSTSASFGRGDQVDGLPRPYTLLAEERIDSVK